MLHLSGMAKRGRKRGGARKNIPKAGNQNKEKRKAEQTPSTFASPAIPKKRLQRLRSDSDDDTNTVELVFICKTQYFLFIVTNFVTLKTENPVSTISAATTTSSIIQANSSMQLQGMVSGLK